jgi:hypothetical protein
MRTKLVAMLLTCGLLVTVTSAWAHHSFAAEFDVNKVLKLRGTVTKMDWVNPHVWVHLDVKNADGRVVGWMIECGSPNALLRRGFNKSSLPEGTELFVEAFQAKDGTNLGNAQNVTRADGKKIFLGSSDEGAPGPGK